MSDPAFFSVRSCTEKRKRRCRVGDRPSLYTKNESQNLSICGHFSSDNIMEKIFLIFCSKRDGCPCVQFCQGIALGMTKNDLQSFIPAILMYLIQMHFYLLLLLFFPAKSDIMKVKRKYFHMFLNQKNFSFLFLGKNCIISKLYTLRLLEMNRIFF